MALVGTLINPWRGARLARALAFVALDLVLGIVGFVFTIVLLSTGGGLLIIFPVGAALLWAMFVLSRGFGRLARSRIGALLDRPLADPHPPLTASSWFGRLRERAGTGSRWREIGYHLALLPVSGLTFSVVIAAWSGSLALAGLPFYVGSLSGRSAELGLFDVEAGSQAWALGALGLVGLAVIAPALTLAMSRLGGALGAALLGPSRVEALGAQVDRLEARRSAAVGSADAERRRIERDLHDGAQQRLVALAMDLGQARERFDEDPEHSRRLVVEAHEEAKAALAELRDLVRGFHPAILEDRGLDPALSAVVARCPFPVDLQVDVAERPSPAVENAAYYVVSEALANVTKHAGAKRARVAIARRGDRLALDVTDDGAGGADPTRGTGLNGLAERVEALGGWMKVLSPPGGPTSVLVELPCGS